MDTTSELLLNYIDISNNKQTEQVVLIYLVCVCMCVQAYMCICVCNNNKKEAITLKGRKG